MMIGSLIFIFLVILSVVVFVVTTIYERKKHYIKNKLMPALDEALTDKPSMKKLEDIDKMLVNAVKYSLLPGHDYTRIVRIMNGYFMNNKDIVKSDELFTKAYRDFLNNIKNIVGSNCE